MNKKGFTLIELLAVIVILAIIAIIAVPIILNVIEDSKKGALKDSAYGIINAGENYLAGELLNETGLEELDIDVTSNVVTYKGGVPDSGRLVITKEGLSAIWIYQNKYCAYKNVDKTEVTVTSVETEQECIDLLGEIPEVVGPILISNAEELNNVRNDLSGNYIIINNINLSGYENFEPIGTSSDPFTGSIDGRDREITGLKINRPTETNIGLFGSVNDANIKNMNMIDVNVTGNRNVGGLVGRVENSSITDSTSSGTVVGVVNDVSVRTSVGGLIGLVETSHETDVTRIINNSSSSSVSGPLIAGGLIGSLGSYYVGHPMAPNSSILVQNNEATGDVTSNLHVVGGLIGEISITATVKNNYTTGNVTLNGDRNIGYSAQAGALIGHMGIQVYSDINTAIIIEENYSSSNVVSNPRGIGFIGAISNNGSTQNIPIEVRNNYYIGNIKQLDRSDLAIGGMTTEIATSGSTTKLNYTNNYIVSDFTGTINLANTYGFIGFYATGSMEVNYIGNIWNTTVSGRTTGVMGSNVAGVVGKTTTEMKTRDTYAGWDTNIWELSDNCYPMLKNTRGPQREKLGCN